MSRSAGPGFCLFILLNAALLVRPHELFPVLLDLPIYNTIMLCCLAVSASAVLSQLSFQSLSRNPIDACVLCLLGSILLSSLIHLEIREGITSAIEFVKVLTYYFLLVALLKTCTDLRRFLVCFCLLVVLMVGLAMAHHYQFISVPALEAMHERQSDEIDEETGQPVVLARLQATGIFENPNDLSRILTVGILLSLYFLGDRSLGLLRPLWLFPISLFGQGLHLTHSRGGLLGLLAGIGALFYGRYGMKKALLLGTLTLPPLLLAFGGRQTRMSTSDGTGQRRIQMWNDAFVALQRSPVFGVGTNKFEHDGHTGGSTHNSFVQCYLDLGFVGGTFFFAIFYLMIRVFLSQGGEGSRDVDPQLIRLRPFLLAVVVATVMGMLSSTRSYTQSTYLIVGVCAAFFRIASDQGLPPMPRFNLNLVCRLLLPSAIALAGLYIYVRLSARY
jgi:hypothetical protein